MNMKAWHLWALSIAYPIVICFLIWLFFLSEDVLSIVDILGGLFAVGALGLVGGGFLLFSIVDFMDERGKPKVLTIIVMVIMAIPMLVFALMLVAVVLSVTAVPICNAVYHMYLAFPTLCIIGGALLLVFIGLTLYIKFGLKKGLLHYPVLRTIYYRLAQLLPLYICIISFSFIILYAIDIESNVPAIGAIELLIAGIFGLFYAFGDNGERVYYITIPHLKYNFFLRPFFKDENLTIDKDIRANFPEYELVEIADPMTKNGNANFNGKSLFLPTKDWKRELSYYIKRANLVFCCIGDSDGVKWEMFEHDNILDKYVFYYDGSVSIQEIVNSVKHKKHMNSKMFAMLNSMQNLSCVAPFYFFTRENSCYYTPQLSDISSYIKDEISADQIQCFAFEYDETQVVKHKSSWRTNISYYIKDLRRVFSIAFRPKTFADILKVFGYLLVFLIVILLFLTGIAFVIFGIVSLVSFLIPSFQQEVLSSLEGLVETPRELFFQSIFEIGLGIVILRQFQNKD